MNKLALTRSSSYQPMFRQNSPMRFRKIWTRGIAAFVVAAATVVAQQVPDADQSQTPEEGTRGLPATLAGQFFDHNFVNYFVFGNGIYDNNVSTSQGAQGGNGG